MKLAKTAPMGGNILSRPFLFLSLLVLIALALLVFRFVYGLGASTNLNNGYPWGLWVVLDIHITVLIFQCQNGILIRIELFMEFFGDLFSISPCSGQAQEYTNKKDYSKLLCFHDSGMLN